MASDSLITIQVCYIAGQKQFLRTLQVSTGSTIQHAIEASGVLDEFDGLDLADVKTGIYSKLKNPQTVLKQHDRIEIYRPLQVDPMVARRARAHKKST